MINIIAAVMKKKANVSFMDCPADLRMLVNSRSNPPSNNMMIRATDVKTLPAIPICAGDTMPNIGPMIIPKIMSMSTSGIFDLSKKCVNTCPKKYRTPNAIIIDDIGSLSYYAFCKYSKIIEKIYIIIVLYCLCCVGNSENI